MPQSRTSPDPRHSVADSTGCDRLLPARRKRPRLYVPSDTELDSDDDTPILVTMQAKRAHGAQVQKTDAQDKSFKGAGKEEQFSAASHDKSLYRAPRREDNHNVTVFKDFERSRVPTTPEGFPDTEAEEHLSPRPGKRRRLHGELPKDTELKSVRMGSPDKQRPENLAPVGKTGASRSVKRKIAQGDPSHSDANTQLPHEDEAAQSRSIRRKRGGLSDRDPRQSAEARAHLETGGGGAGAKPSTRFHRHNQARPYVHYMLYNYNSLKELRTIRLNTTSRLQKENRKRKGVERDPTTKLVRKPKVRSCIGFRPS